jgi:hypothetical protein
VKDLPRARLPRTAWLSLAGMAGTSFGALLVATVLIGNVTGGRYTGFGAWLATEYGGIEVALGVAYGIAASCLAARGTVRWVARASALVLAPGTFLAQLPLFLPGVVPWPLALLVAAALPVGTVPLLTAEYRRTVEFPAGARTTAELRTVVVGSAVSAAASLAAAFAWWAAAGADDVDLAPALAVTAPTAGPRPA